MALPVGVDGVTVSSGKPLTRFDGTPIQGKLLFSGPDVVTVAGQEVFLGGTTEAKLIDGEFAVTLVAPDTAGMSPSGWTYRVTAAFSNAPGWVRYVSLSKAAPSVTLADVIVPDPVAGTFTVLVDPSTIGGSTPASTVVGETAFGQASAVGTATPYARADHRHGTPALPSASTSAAGVVQLDGTAADIQALGAQAAGSVGKAADAGHVHPATGLVLTSDPRLTDGRAPTGTASGDLSGPYPGPTVAKVNGVAVTGAAASGKVLTATSSSAATWQTPAVGGGGGATITSRDGRIDTQIITLVPVAGWAIVATSGGVEIGTSVPASVGDRIWYSPSFLRTYGVFLDMGIKAAAGGVSRYTSSNGPVPEPDGYAPLYPEAAFAGVAGMREFVVQAGEVDGSGNATIVLAYRGDSVSSGTQKVYFGGGPGYSGAIFVANMRQ